MAWCFSNIYEQYSVQDWDDEIKEFDTDYSKSIDLSVLLYFESVREVAFDLFKNGDAYFQFEYLVWPQTILSKYGTYNNSDFEYVVKYGSRDNIQFVYRYKKDILDEYRRKITLKDDDRKIYNTLTHTENPP
jgi:hypothetical protein